jgi:hypothetical protein
LALLLTGILGGCGKEGAPGPSTPGDPSSGGSKSVGGSLLFEDRETLELRPYRGRVVALASGSVGCEHSEQLFEEGLKAAKAFEDAVFLHVHTGQSVEAAREYYKAHPPTVHVVGDPTGKIRDSLPTPVTPSFFLYGKWGKLRYVGAFAWDSFRSMMTALSKETQPEEKNVFLKKGLDKGDPLAPFTLPDIWGGEIALDAFRADAKAVVLGFTGLG